MFRAIPLVALTSSNRMSQAINSQEFLNKKMFIHDIDSFDLCYDELFVQEMYNFLAKRTNPYIIDCGANLGMSIVYFKELYPEANIVAFEADEHVFSFLEKNVQSFGYKNVELVNKAVWNKDDVLSFIVEGGAGGRLEEQSENGNYTYKYVPCVSVRKYLMDKKVDFFKIDIEGAEYPLLDYLFETGLIKVFKKTQVQFHDFDEDCLEKLLYMNRKLAETHQNTLCYPFVWEEWQIRN